MEGHGIAGRSAGHLRDTLACRLLARVGAGHRLAVVSSLRDMRVWELHQAGLSVRAVARQVGLSRSQVHRIISNPAPDMSPIAYLNGDQDDDDDPWTDDDEVPLALLADDAIRPHEVLVPPFAFAGLMEVPDNFPTRRHDNKIRQAPQWRDANGQAVSEVDLWRYGHRLDTILPGDYPDRETYLAAWDAANDEIEAAKAHAWESLRAAGVVYDDGARRWVQRPQAV